jgi:hypothetical protein
VKPHPLLACLVFSVPPACSTSSTTSPTPTTSGSLQVTIAPNPLPQRVAGEPLVWNVTFRAGAVGLRLERSEAVVTDASGATFAERQEF